MPVISTVVTLGVGFVCGAYFHARLTRRKEDSSRESQSGKRAACREPKVTVHPFDAGNVAESENWHEAREEYAQTPLPTPDQVSKSAKSDSEKVDESSEEIKSEAVPHDLKLDAIRAKAEGASETEPITDDLSDLSVEKKVETPAELLLKAVSAMSKSTVERPGSAYVKQTLDHFFEDHTSSGNPNGSLLDLMTGLGKVAMDFEDQAESNVSLRDVLQESNMGLCEIMRHAGAHDLNPLEGFSYLMHIPVNASGVVKEGRPIVRFLTSGLGYDGHVVKRARVELAQE